MLETMVVVRAELHGHVLERSTVGNSGDVARAFAVEDDTADSTLDGDVLGQARHRVGTSLADFNRLAFGGSCDGSLKRSKGGSANLGNDNGIGDNDVVSSVLCSIAGLLLDSRATASANNHAYSC